MIIRHVTTYLPVNSDFFERVPENNRHPVLSFCITVPEEIFTLSPSQEDGATEAAEPPARSEEAAGIPPDKIDKTVRSLSEHMGWDITKGSGAG
ncbi:MAG: hypothetical protein D3909_18785 [Candidatus Electrothrix sp. ATG1]|nr:hypothetical protein [Candidatus Electrothrix sp. ATG1]